MFLLEKHIEEVKEGEKIVPDLMESAMRPSGHMKEELRLTLFKINQFRYEITKIRV